MKITFVGGGNMAQAMIGGLLKKGFAAGDLTAIEVLAETRDVLAKRLGVRAVAAAREAAPFGDLVVMAVKPQQMREAAASVRAHLSRELVLSIAAGIRLSDLSRWLGGYAILARCMPNTPALIGEGVSALYCSSAASAEQRGYALALLGSVGEVVEVADEGLLDAVTAVSGSGPAYVFLFIEAMQRAARELGLSAEQARALSIQTFAGAARLAAESGEEVGVLRERVTSKGGTTERALASMREDRVIEAIVRAIRAAYERSRELGEQLGRDD